jgi:hypothetical protein
MHRFQDKILVVYLILLNLVCQLITTRNYRKIFFIVNEFFLSLKEKQALILFDLYLNKLHGVSKRMKIQAKIKKKTSIKKSFIKIATIYIFLNIFF